MPSHTSLTTRRHDLDWLRIIAFGILIFYHIGMFYVTWGWHIKSSHMSTASELPMMLTNVWRLSLLFFISGVAVRFAAAKQPLLSFAGTRTWRLLLPLVFGIFVIVPPQTYFELLEDGRIPADWWGFYRGYVGPLDTYEGLITPTWNHLWYVAYVLVYSLLAVPLAGLFRVLGDERIERGVAAVLGGGRIWRLIAFVPVPFIVYDFTLSARFPTTHALVDDWATHANAFTVFLLGFVVAKSPAFWTAVARALPVALIGAVLLGALFVLAYWWDRSVADITDGRVLAAIRVSRTVYGWLVILSLAGLAQRYLNRPGPALRYMTQAIFPWYILHQTIIVVAGFWLARQGLTAWPEFLILCAVTIAGCALLHELVIRRVAPLRPLFGLKWRE